MLDWTEAAVGRCSSKELFLKISQYSQENPCVGIFLIKLQTRWLLLIGVKFTLKNFYADFN